MRVLPAVGLLLSLILMVPASASAQEWREGFEAGLGSTKTYQPEDGTVLELGQDGPAEGTQYVRAVLPGKNAREGLNVTATGLSGGRLATVSAQVRGKGELWLCLISRNGWLYSPDTVVLSDRWQTVSLSKVLVAADSRLGIHFLTKTLQTGMVFEVDDVQVKTAAPPTTYDAAVGPWRFEAEEYTRHWSHISDDATALGGRAIQSGYVSVAGVPFPRTSRSVTISVRVRPGSLQESYRVWTRQGGNQQVLATLKPGKVGEWQWLRFPALTAGEVGESFDLDCSREKDATGSVALDAVVLATTGDLSDEALAGAGEPLAVPGPLAMVARATHPPALDGRADDACWQHTVACSDFLILGLAAAAQAQTEVRLCYDDANLYLHFTCHEPILNVAGQRRGEFLARITDRDGDVYADDSAVVLLDPTNTGRQVFDFTVNAVGTITDARCPGPSLWDSRDVTWNSGARATGVIGEDVWTLEMTIPFADLGGTPDVGDVWQACLGRIARARKETSSWNPSGGGVHAPNPLGSLVFGDTTPGVLLRTPAALQLGKNPLAVALAAPTGQPTGAYLMVDTAAVQAKTRSREYIFVRAPERAAEIAAEFETRAEGQLRLRYAVLDAATLTPWYAGPTLTRVAKTSLAQVTLDCDGPYELVLNDEVISRGAKAPAEAITAPLQTGANVFALRLEQGTAAVRVEAPGGAFTAESWRMSAADTKDATVAALDDLSWPMAQKTGEHPQLGPIVGEAGTPLVLRRTLLWEKTRIWPTPEPAWYLARGPAQHITVRTEGLTGKKLDGWTTYLATPPDYEVIGSTGFYGQRPDQPRFECTQLGMQQVNGREMRVVRVKADKPLLSGRHYIMSEFEAFIRYREEAGEPESAETEFFYWSEANGGNITEPPQALKVRLLPKLNGGQPRTLTFQLWGGWLSNMDDVALREEVLRCARAAGFNDIVDSVRWTSDTGSRYGLSLTLTTNFKSWEMNLAPHLAEHPDQRLTKSDGTPSDSLMCTSLLLGDGWPTVEGALQKRLEDVRPATVDIDYEYGPRDGPHSCYCPDCLAAFREFAKLPPDAVLDAATVNGQHGELWVDFMARRVAQVFARFKEATHRLAPGTRFSVYSGYQVPDNPKVYGINWQYIGDLQACDRAGAGYGEPEPDIARTVEALQGIPLLAGLLVTPYDRTSPAPLSPLTRAGVLRLLLAGSGGVLVYERCSHDGRVWQAVADVSRLAATHEDVFLGGRAAGNPPVAMPGFAITECQMLRVADTTLVCALNTSAKSVTYTIRLPADAGAGAEFYTGEKVAAGQEVTCALAAGDAAVYVLHR